MNWNAGCRTLTVRDELQATDLVVQFLYPTRAAEHDEAFGPFRLPLARDAPIEGRAHSLIVISHGTGGTPWTHRGLAAHLARSGFAVALLQHPGNHRGDDSLAFTVQNLENRPRHVRLAIDAALADEHVSRGGVGVIGHSLGAYTALAVAGGQPTAFPRETPEGQSRVLHIPRDPRVRALVLLAPATAWFKDEGALDEVDVPILMLTGELDLLAGPFHAQIVERGLGDASRLEHRVIERAGHYSFLSAYPPEQKSAALPPSQDPEGFDREAFLPGMYAQIVEFFTRSLEA
ncbi:MAG TPA: alpha/beta hydrolase [Polyangiales bacterium]|nr:alpha/beta hydrolase [Polyangiales bacterium]